jgi:hypothetical protein
MQPVDLNWLAIIVAAVSTFILGGLWYGPLFGRVWMRASGVSEAQAAGGNKGLIFGVSLLLQLIAALVLDMFIGTQGTLAFGTAAGAAVGLFWVATAFGVVYLFEQRPLAHWAVNSFYHIVSYTIMGAILGAWN